MRNITANTIVINLVATFAAVILSATTLNAIVA